MLRGFNYPLTPKGLSTLNPPPPWYYSADFLSIEFWSEPSAVAALLPKGLIQIPQRTSRQRPVLRLAVQWRKRGISRTSPLSVREFLLLVDALYKGNPVSYCLTSSLTTMRHSPAAGLRVIRSGSARYSRLDTTRLRGKRSALAPGSKFAGSLTAGGQRSPRRS